MSINFYFNQEKSFLNKELILSSNKRFEKIYQNGIYQTNLNHIREITAKSICTGKKECVILPTISY